MAFKSLFAFFICHSYCKSEAKYEYSKAFSSGRTASHAKSSAASPSHPFFDNADLINILGISILFFPKWGLI